MVVGALAALTTKFEKIFVEIGIGRMLEHSLKIAILETVEILKLALRCYVSRTGSCPPLQN